MKRLIKKVELSFFQDDANGEWGLCHKNTQDSDNGFNAFWNGLGIFHDVFEHSHEHTNKYFRNDYAMNVGGEMAAMGSMWYYYNSLNVSNRMNGNGYHAPSESMKQTTLNEVKEALYSGYCRYGYTLESNVPKQSPVDDSELEYQIEDFWKQVKTSKIECTDEQEIEFAKQYKQSVTFRKIADLHRYGFRMAERIVPDNYANRNTLYSFIELWDDFCKKNSAEDLAKDFDDVIVKLYKEDDQISWTATLVSRYPSEVANVKLTENNIKYFCIEDAWIPQEF